MFTIKNQQLYVKSQKHFSTRVTEPKEKRVMWKIEAERQLKVDEILQECANAEKRRLLKKF